MLKQSKLTGVYIGQVKQVYGLETAIEKSSVTDDIYLSQLGLATDECADKKHHGGEDRALHQYPLEHYTYWQKKYGNHINWQAPGMGENLSSAEMTEHTVCIGDQYRWGEAIIEVSQPRSPCFKLNKRWQVDSFSVDMQRSGRCGWLYRVLTPGVVNVNLPLELIHREQSPLTVHQTSDLYFNQPLNKAGLETLAHQSKLAKSWQEKVKFRRETGQVENWNFRLLGHA